MAASFPDDAFRALADSRRRQLLTALLEHNPQQELSVFDADELGGSNEKREKIEFRHVHLPMLEEHGYIEWDRESHTIVKGPNFTEIEPLLELLVRHTDEPPKGRT